MFVLPNCYVRKQNCIEQKVGLTSNLHVFQYLIHNFFLFEDLTVKSCSLQSLLNELFIQFLETVQEQSIAQEVAVESHILQAEIIFHMGKQSFKNIILVVVSFEHPFADDFNSVLGLVVLLLTLAPFSTIIIYHFEEVIECDFVRVNLRSLTFNFFFNILNFVLGCA